jgi:hypothetical protein
MSAVGEGLVGRERPTGLSYEQGHLCPQRGWVVGVGRYESLPLFVKVG